MTKTKRKPTTLAKREPAQLAFTLPGATATALKLPSGLEFKKWEQMGGTLRTVATASKWWAGDWLIYGETTYGEAYSQAMDVLGASVDGLARAMKVSQRIEPARRRRSLSWTHHALVASLEPAEQDEWLTKAVEGKWTSQELRDQIKGEAPERTPKCCHGCACEGKGCACAVPVDPAESGAR